MTLRHRHPQQGAVAVEFALVVMILLTVLIGSMEMGRLFWTWNAAAEATRAAARIAVVCPKNSDAIVTRMRQALPLLTEDNVTIEYLNPPLAVNSCTDANCKSVRVTLEGYTHQTVIPFVPLDVPIPPFQTTLPREYMNSDGSNPQCG